MEHAFLGITVPVSAPLDLLDLIQAGLPAESLAAFKAATDMSDEDIAQLLNIGGRTLTRLRGASQDRLPADVSDRLLSPPSIDWRKLSSVPPSPPSAGSMRRNSD